jgi:hypothetical protein
MGHNPPGPNRSLRILGEESFGRCRGSRLRGCTRLRFRLALFRSFLQLASRMLFAGCQTHTRDEQNETKFLHVE